MGRTLNVLFVCTGNTCRSVLAQAFLERIWEEVSGENRQVNVFSAGVAPAEGLGASEEALAVLRSYGIDFCGHRSSRVTPELVQQAHYIFTMTRGQRDYLLNCFPEVKEKVWLLKEYAGDSSEEISDPFGGGLAAYRQAAAEIREALKKIVTRWSASPEKEEKGREKTE